MNSNIKKNGLIHNPKQRSERSEYKKQQLLNWLVDFTWTTPAIAGQVMGLMSRSAINKSLRQFEDMGLIKSAYLEIVCSRDIRIIGITPNGLLWCDNHDQAFSKAHFDPARVALSTANHRLDVQKCRLKLHSINNLEWTAENNYPKSLQYRPDAIIKFDKCSIALELERTAKTRKRYKQIIIQHLKQINKGAYKQVHYVSTIDGFAPRLQRLFFSIEKLPVRGQQVMFGSELRKHFKFYEFEDWNIKPEPNHQ